LAFIPSNKLEVYLGEINIITATEGSLAFKAQKAGKVVDCDDVLPQLLKILDKGVFD